MEPKKYCPNCLHTLTGIDYFCPFCGMQIRLKPADTSTVKQISIYLVSALLPPAGLWPAYKYLKEADPKAKKIGLIALIISIVSIVLSIVLLSSVVNTVNTQMESALNSGILGY